LYGKGNKYHELGTRLVLCIRESYWKGWSLLVICYSI
jgi:hypothetical protein